MDSVSNNEEEDDDYDVSSDSFGDIKKKKIVLSNKANTKVIATKKSVTQLLSKPINDSSVIAKPSAASSKTNNAPNNNKRKLLSDDDDDDDSSVEFFLNSIEKENLNKSNYNVNKKASPPAKTAKVSQPKTSPTDMKKSAVRNSMTISSQKSSVSMSSGGAAEVDITKGDNIATETAAKNIEIFEIRNKFCTQLYGSMKTQIRLNSNEGDGKLNDFFKDLVEFRPTTVIGSVVCFILFYPPTKCLITKDSLGNKTGRYSLILYYLKNSLSFILTI